MHKYNICYTKNVAAYKAPDVPQDQVTTLLVRDELLKCFESANREFATIQNQSPSDQALKEQVRQFVTSVFADCGVAFDNPSKGGIITAIGQCRSNAVAMMGPSGSEIIEHHYSEMMKLVSRLPD